MNSTQGRDTIFTNVNLRTIIPPKHHLKKSQQQIKDEQSQAPRLTKGKEIFQDGGKKKYEQSKSIDFSKSKIDDLSVQKKGIGTYNTEILRRQLETNPTLNQQGIRNEDSKKIKTYFNDPSIKLNTISKDFTVKAEDCSDSKVQSKPNYYLSSKNVQRTLNQESNFQLTGKLNNRKSNLSMTYSNLSQTIDQYRSNNNQNDNTSTNTTTTKTSQMQKTPSHQRYNTETVFNQVPRIPYKNIHNNKVGLSNNGVGFYMY